MSGPQGTGGDDARSGERSDGSSPTRPGAAFEAPSASGAPPGADEGPDELPNPAAQPDWERVYEDHAEAVLGVGRRWLRPEPRATAGVSADDIRQEVFAQAIERGMQDQGPGQTRRYLTTSATWQANRAVRRGGREGPVGDFQDAPAGRWPPADEVDDRLEDAWAVEESLAHFVCLTDRERQIMEEVVHKGRDVWLVAEELNVTITRVRQLRVAAGRRLYRCLDGKNPDCRVRPLGQE